MVLESRVAQFAVLVEEQCVWERVTRFTVVQPGLGSPPQIDIAGDSLHGYAMSQRVRRRIEVGFGWGNEVGLLRRIRVRGRKRVDMEFACSAAACNLIRLPKLLTDAMTA